MKRTLQHFQVFLYLSHAILELVVFVDVEGFLFGKLVE